MAESSEMIRVARLSQASREAAIAAAAARACRDQEMDRLEAAGYSVREIARAAQVSPATVLSALSRVATGQTAP